MKNVTMTMPAAVAAACAFDPATLLVPGYGIAKRAWVLGEFASRSLGAVIADANTPTSGVVSSGLDLASG